MLERLQTLFHGRSTRRFRSATLWGNSKRRLRLEVLEDRAVSSANGFEGNPALISQPAPTQNSANYSAQDKQFLIEAAQGDQQEMVLGSLAATFGQDAGVRGFGEILLHDHARLFAAIMPLLQQAGLTLQGLLSGRRKG